MLKSEQKLTFLSVDEPTDRLLEENGYTKFDTGVQKIVALKPPLYILPVRIEKSKKFRKKGKFEYFISIKGDQIKVIKLLIMLL